MLDVCSMLLNEEQRSTQLSVETNYAIRYDPKGDTFNDSLMQYLHDNGMLITNKDQKEFATHTSMMGGSWALICVPPNKYHEFIRMYIHTLNNNQKFDHCISELGTKQSFPFFIDWDALDDHEWHEEEILILTRHIQDCICEHYSEITESRRLVLLQCVVTKTACVSKNNMIKNPIHFHFDSLLVNQEIAIRLNYAIAMYLSKKYKHLENQMADICDWKVYVNVNLRMLYSNRKMDCPVCHKKNITLNSVNKRKRKEQKKSNIITEEDVIEKLENSQKEIQDEEIFSLLAELSQIEMVTKKMINNVSSSSGMISCTTCYGSRKIVERRAYEPYLVINGTGSLDKNELTKLKADKYSAILRTCVRAIQRKEDQIMWATEPTPGFKAINTRNIPDVEEVVQKLSGKHSRSNYIPTMIQTPMINDKFMIRLPLDDTRCGYIVNFLRKYMQPLSSVPLKYEITKFYSDLTLSQVTLVLKPDAIKSLKSSLTEMSDFEERQELIRKVANDLSSINHYFVRVRGENAKWCDNIGSFHNSSTVWFDFNLKSCQTRCSCSKNNQNISQGSVQIACKAFKGRNVDLISDMKEKLYGIVQPNQQKNKKKKDTKRAIRQSKSNATTTVNNFTSINHSIVQKVPVSTFLKQMSKNASEQKKQNRE